MMWLRSVQCALLCLVITVGGHRDPCTTYSSQDQCPPPIIPLFSEHLPSHMASSAAALPACGEHLNSSTTIRRFLNIGDFGIAGNCAFSVSLLARHLESQFGTFDFIFTNGDNNYWGGDCESFGMNLGDYYSSFFTKSSECINPSQSNQRLVRDSMTEARQELLASGRADQPIRFLPTMGNHDFDNYRNFPDKMPHLQYFNYLSLLPTSDQGLYAQYYTYSPVPEIQLWSLNSNLGDPANNMMMQFREQMDWFKMSITSSNAPFKFVFFHHPPFCTAQHDPLASWMDLPYESWNVTAVFAGHQHVYERIYFNDQLFIVNGLGGHPWLYEIHNCKVFTGSVSRHNTHHGALLGLVSHNADELQLDMCFYSVEDGGTLVDHVTVTQPLGSRTPPVKRLKRRRSHDRS